MIFIVLHTLLALISTSLCALSAAALLKTGDSSWLISTLVNAASVIINVWVLFK